MTRIDLAWFNRDLARDPIAVRTMKEIVHEPRNRFLRGLAVGLPIALLLWGLIAAVFLL